MPLLLAITFKAEAEAVARPPHAPAQAAAPTMLLAAAKADECAVKVPVAAPADSRAAQLIQRLCGVGAFA